MKTQNETSESPETHPVVKRLIEPATCIHLMYSTVWLIQKTLGLTKNKKKTLACVKYFPQKEEKKEINGALF